MLYKAFRTTCCLYLPQPFTIKVDRNKPFTGGTTRLAKFA